MKVKHVKTGNVGELIDKKSVNGRLMYRVRYTRACVWGLAENYDAAEPLKEYCVSCGDELVRTAVRGAAGGAGSADRPESVFCAACIRESAGHAAEPLEVYCFSCGYELVEELFVHPDDPESVFCADCVPRFMMTQAARMTTAGASPENARAPPSRGHGHAETRRRGEQQSAKHSKASRRHREAKARGAAAGSGVVWRRKAKHGQSKAEQGMAAE